MESGPEQLAELLSRLFIARGWGRRQDRLRLERAWREAVGELHAGSTQLGSLRHGVLEVVVEDAVLLQQLVHFEKKRLIAAIAPFVPGKRLADIRFRLGAVGR